MSPSENVLKDALFSDPKWQAVARIRRKAWDPKPGAETGVAY